jgi:hypothetical protein
MAMRLALTAGLPLMASVEPAELVEARHGRAVSVTREYLIGELSVLLEKLLAVTRTGAAGEVAKLRYRVEDEPDAWLAVEMSRALALADQLCWESLSRGDALVFDRQAAICAELHLFGACAGLIGEELEHSPLIRLPGIAASSMATQNATLTINPLHQAVKRMP